VSRIQKQWTSKPFYKMEKQKHLANEKSRELKFSAFLSNIYKKLLHKCFSFDTIIFVVKKERNH
jgi:hypothetical protein